MPYYPTEHDWTLTERPVRLSLEERFPVRYAVNKLVTDSHKGTLTTQCQIAGVSNRNLQKAASRRGSATRNSHENPNLTPIGHGRGMGTPSPDVGLWAAEPASHSVDIENTDKSCYTNTSGWD